MAGGEKVPLAGRLVFERGRARKVVFDSATMCFRALAGRARGCLGMAAACFRVLAGRERGCFDGAMVCFRVLGEFARVVFVRGCDGNYACFVGEAMGFRALAGRARGDFDRGQGHFSGLGRAIRRRAASRKASGMPAGVADRLPVRLALSRP